MRRLHALVAASLLLTSSALGGSIIMGPVAAGGSCGGASLPTVRAVGAHDSATGAATPGLPAGTTSGDLLIMACETSTGQGLTVSGWTELSGSPIDEGTGTQLNIFHKVAAGGDATTTSDSGDHQQCRIVGLTTSTYCSTPFGEYNENTQTSTTSVSVSGVTTTVNNALVFSFYTGDLPDTSTSTEFSAGANADLGSIVERFDNTTTANNGGALGMFSATKVTAGSVGASTTTAVTAAVRANAMVVVNGP